MHIDPNLLANGFPGNTRVMGRLVDGLTHADSLLVPPFGGNCLNWVMGHILVSRQRALTLLDAPPVVAADLAQYETGSDPLSPEDALPLPDLLAALEAAANHAAERLATLTADDLAAPHGDDSTVGQRLHGLYWHESYHIGQIEQLRRLAGHTEKVFG